MPPSRAPKTIVITGCSTGIGLACTKAALLAGHIVIATARRDEDLTMLEALGAKAIPLELNSPESVADAARQIADLSQQHIDILFNNAGYGLQVAMEDCQWQDLQDQLSTNVIGPVILTNKLLSIMPSGGKLIFNSSILGLITIPFRGPYCISKYAVEAASDAYRLESASLGISVHTIEPGPIEANFRRTAANKIRDCLDDKKTRLNYKEHLQRLDAEALTAGTLPASACAEIFMDLVSGKKHQPRYLVTRTAKIAAFAKRLLGSHFYHIAKNNPKLEVNR